MRGEVGALHQQAAADALVVEGWLDGAEGDDQHAHVLLGLAKFERAASCRRGRSAPRELAG
jgi:hypothetical protein